MMTVSDAAARLRDAARTGGLRPEAADVALGWRIFREFAVEPVARCADDAVDVFIGVHPRIAGGRVVARFGRRFEVSDGDKEYDHTEVVSLLFVAARDVHPVVAPYARSTVGFRRPESFFAAVEGAAAFAAAVAHRDWRYTVEHWSSRAPPGVA